MPSHLLMDVMLRKPKPFLSTFRSSRSSNIGFALKSNTLLRCAKATCLNSTGVDHKHFDALRAIYKNFSTEDAQKIKDIEKVTNHDVKAVEYFIKEAFETLGLSQFQEFIHFGLTSQDINNTSVPLSVKEALGRGYLPFN